MFWGLLQCPVKAVVLQLVAALLPAVSACVPSASYWMPSTAFAMRCKESLSSALSHPRLCLFLHTICRLAGSSCIQMVLCDGPTVLLMNLGPYTTAPPPPSHTHTHFWCARRCSLLPHSDGMSTMAAATRPITCFVTLHYLCHLSLCRFASIQMALCALPAVLLMNLGPHNTAGAATLDKLQWVWAGLTLVMALRAASIWLPYALGLPPFKVLTPQQPQQQAQQLKAKHQEQ